MEAAAADALVDQRAYRGRQLSQDEIQGETGGEQQYHMMGGEQCGQHRAAHSKSLDILAMHAALSSSCHRLVASARLGPSGPLMRFIEE